MDTQRYSVEEILAGLKKEKNIKQMIQDYERNKERNDDEERRNRAETQQLEEAMKNIAEAHKLEEASENIAEAHQLEETEENIVEPQRDDEQDGSDYLNEEFFDFSGNGPVELPNSPKVSPRNQFDAKYIKRAAVAGAIAGGIIAGSVVYLIGKLTNKKVKNPYTVITTVKAPEGVENVDVKVDKKEIKSVPVGTIVFVDTNKKSPKDSNTVSFTDEEGKMYTGVISSENLSENAVAIPESTLYEYNNIYRAHDGANLRSAREMGEEAVFTSIPEDSIVLGKSPEKDGDFSWVSVLSYGENGGVVFLEARADVLDVLEQNIYNDKDYVPFETEATTEIVEKQNEEKVYIVSTNGVPLKVRNEASTTADVVGKIENGQEVIISDEDMAAKISADGYNWVYIKDKSGYVASDYLTEKAEPGRTGDETPEQEDDERGE